RNIINNSKLPVILVGGSMLYLDSVIYDYTLPKDFDNSNKYEDYSNEELYELLKNKDPLSANKLHMNNRNRVATALNYYEQFHESIVLNKNKTKLVYDVFFIYLKPVNKQRLNKQNALRIKKMLQLG
ncbi:tRNA (adenosine(37)-N6)-dimethylallyltransferase MiaA, partial [bacterium]|nr:tRNA (adenosine(37)-N6)-dimethylallyltransferase MiaA [bacterium]